MGAQTQPQHHPQPKGWTIQGAEHLLTSLTGVVSARLVARAGGEIEEIHVLTTDEVSPKSTVRNVESALLARFDLTVDHRKISVAQTKAPVLPMRPVAVESDDASKASASAGAAGAATGPRPMPDSDVADAPGAPGAHPAGHPASPGRAAASDPADVPAEGRLLFAGHEMEPEHGRRIRFRVNLEWKGEQYTGEAVGADLPRSRLDIVAEATLRSIEALLAGPDELDEDDTSDTSGEAGAADAGDAGHAQGIARVASIAKAANVSVAGTTSKVAKAPPRKPRTQESLTLSLDGIKLVEAFDRRYVMVGVHAITPRKLTVLVGSVPVDDSPDRSAILATLQATDRWVRGRLE